MWILGRAALPTLLAASLLQLRSLPPAWATLPVLNEEPLVQALLDRTAANRERNEATVRRATEAAAFVSIAGEPGVRRQILGTDGAYIYLSRSDVARLTRRGELACAMDGTCRVVDRERAPPLHLDLPELKELKCDAAGRNCKFQPS